MFNNIWKEFYFCDNNSTIKTNFLSFFLQTPSDEQSQYLKPTLSQKYELYSHERPRNVLSKNNNYQAFVCSRVMTLIILIGCHGKVANYWLWLAGDNRKGLLWEKMHCGCISTKAFICRFVFWFRAASQRERIWMLWFWCTMQFRYDIDMIH